LMISSGVFGCNAALYNATNTHDCKLCFYYLVIADSITPTLNKLSAPHYCASQVLR